jgi:hypothetical protein
MAEDVQRISGTTAKVAARLCNFDTGQAILLLAHEKFLDEEVAPVIRGMQGPWVDLFGYASRRGDATFNRRLSDNRLKAVRWRIDQYANRVNFQIQVGFGETQSGPNERSNDGYWRAVEVYVYAHKPPPPKPPTPGPWLRRVTFRSFSKTEPKPDMLGTGAPDALKDSINDLLKLGQAAAQGKLMAEGLLGKETSRRISEFPSDNRVNRVILNKKIQFDSGVGGTVTQTDADITYEWGLPMPTVIIETLYQFTWNNKANPPISETRTLSRKLAESAPLVVPPDP